MAATPFKGVLQTRYGSLAGPKGPSYRFSCSDVAAAFATFDDIPGTPSFVTAPPGPLVIDDILLSAAGVDTKALQVTRGVASTETILRDAAMVETLSVDPNGRCQGLRGTPLMPGVQYGLKQLA